MNEEMNYRMDWDERRQYVYDRAYEILEGDNDAFVEACNELNCYNGFLGEDECIPMWEIDEFFNKPSELLDAMDDFNPSDEYFYFRNGNLESCDDMYEHYSEAYSIDEVLDELINNYYHISLNENKELCEVLGILYDEDFGIDEDFDEEDIEDYESDEEFTQRIADIM